MTVARMVSSATPKGLVWVPKTNSFQLGWQKVDCSSDATKILATRGQGYLYYSSDGGATWETRFTDASRLLYGISMSDDGTYMIAASNLELKIFYSTNGGLNWTQSTVPWNGSFSFVAGSPSGQYAISGQSSTDVYITTDYGANWTQRIITNSGGIGARTAAISSNGQTIVATGESSFIWLSTNGGVTWTRNEGAGTQSWMDIAMTPNGTKMAACVGASSAGYIWTSSDSGVTWTERTTSGSRYWQTVSMSDDGTTIVAADNNNQTSPYGSVYISKDSGATWSLSVGSSGKNWKSLKITPDGKKIVGAPQGDYIYVAS